MAKTLPCVTASDFRGVLSEGVNSKLGIDLAKERKWRTFLDGNRRVRYSTIPLWS